MEGPLLRVEGLSKSFDGVRALDGASLSVEMGEVHGLVGENGAGKSTLIKVLSGVHAPDSGSVFFDGHALALGSVAASEKAGIAVVHQESTAFRDLKAEENMFVGHEPLRFGVFLDRGRMRERAQAAMDRIGESAGLGGALGEVSLAQQQLVAIARAVSSAARLVVFDEPTASLSVKEALALHAAIRRLKSEGVSVLYVSHRLDEIFEVCDRVTVMRDGGTVETRGVGDVTREGLIRAMVGRDIEAVEHMSVGQGPVRLSVMRATRSGAFHDVSFDVHSGEIVGLGGLGGAGRSELVRAVFGIDPPDSGQVLVDEKELRRGDVAASVRAGVALVPEDRQHEGLVVRLSVATNLVMAVRDRFSRAGFVSRQRERACAVEQIKGLAIRASGPEALVSSLSGGNQQKVAIGKWLATGPRVLILDEPTRGVDVGAKAEIHRIVRGLAQGGTAVLVVSSDLPELLALSDRVLVMRAGRVVGELSRKQATPETFLSLALAEAAG